LNAYWLKIALGLLIVSSPFLIAAIQKKISWQFFWSWTLTSVFATLTFLFVQHSIEKHVDPKTKMIISFGTGIVFMGVGLYMRTIQSSTVRNVGWLFVIFGFAWIFLSI
jgi:hypothetical protein